MLRNLLDQRLAPRRPVLRCERCQSLLRTRLERAAAGGLQRRHQCAQGFLHVGLERDLGAVVLGEIPIDQADLHDRKPVRQRVGLAVDRHPQRIAAERNDEIVGLQRLARDFLDARQRAHEARAFRQELRAIGRRGLVGRTAQRFRQLSGFPQRIAFHDLVADDDHGPLRFQDARGKRLQRFVRRLDAGIDAGRAAEFDAGFGVEDIARQRDEYRPGRRRGGDLGSAAHDPRQIFQPRHLDRPFHQRLGHLHQRPIEYRLRQAVALLLLAGGQDQRRAGEAGIVERAHRVAETWCYMDVAGDELARGAAETVGHGDDEALLHRHHVGEIRMILQRVHDRQFGGAGIAEQMRDAFVLQQGKECGAAGDFVLHVSSSPRARLPAG